MCHMLAGSTEFVMVGLNSGTNLDENHLLKSENHATNDQEKCLIITQNDKKICDSHKLSLTNTGGLWPKQTVCERHIMSVWHRLTLTNTNSLWQTQLFCDRHILPVIDLYFLWQTKKICDRQPLSVTDIGCLWQKETVFDRHKLTLKDTYCLWQTQTVCERHRRFVTDTNCLSLTQIVCDRHRLCMAEACCDCDSGIFFFRKMYFRLKTTLYPISKLNKDGRGGGEVKKYLLSQNLYFEVKIGIFSFMKKLTC